MIDEQVPQIADFGPTIVTFQSGANDIVNAIPIDQYRTDVGTILDAATDAGAAVVVLAQNEWYRSPLIAGGDYGDADAFAQQRDEYDQVLLDEADARGATFVDLRDIHERSADEDLWVEDGIHPTPEVYAEWATAIAEDLPSPCG